MSNVQKIDFLSGIEVDREIYHDHLRVLLHYKAGIDSIYQICKQQESKLLNEGPGVITLYRCDIPKDFYWLLPSYFQWFSVSTCNYARMVGFLKGVSMGMFPSNRLKYDKNERKSVKEYCNHYMNSITELKAVKKWRNKVAGHPAIVDPGEENDLTREASIFISYPIEEGRFLSKSLVHRQIRNGKHIKDDLEIWSITKAFEDLAPRFWPNIIK